MPGPCANIIYLPIAVPPRIPGPLFSPPFLLHRPLRHRQCESKCNVFWLPWNSRRQAKTQSLSLPAVEPSFPLFLSSVYPRQAHKADEHGYVSHCSWRSACEKLSGCASVIFVKTDFHCGILDTARFTQSFSFTFCQEGFKLSLFSPHV